MKKSVLVIGGYNSYRQVRLASLWNVIIATIFVFFISVVCGLFIKPAISYAATANSTINFQAHLKKPNGVPVDDGTYNIEFKMYDSQSGGHLLWTETRTNVIGAGVMVSKGYVSAQLGSVNPFPANMPWNQQIWLTMNIGGSGQSPVWDGEMNPRLALTAVPYAYQAGQLAMLTGTNTSTLGWAAQTNPNNLLLPDTSGTLCVSGDSASCGFAPGNQNTYIQNSTSPQDQANFNIGGSGTIGGNLVLNGTNAGIVSTNGGLQISSLGGDLALSTTGAGNNITITSAHDVNLIPGWGGDVVIGAETNGGSITLGNGDDQQQIYIAGGNGSAIVDIASVGTSGNTVNIASEDTAGSDVINIGTGSTSSPNGKIINIGTGTPTGNGSNQITIGAIAAGSNTTIRGDGLVLQTVGYSASLSAKGLGLGGSAVKATADISFANGSNRGINTLQAATGQGNDLSITAGQGADSADNGGNLVLKGGAAGGAAGLAGSVVARANGSDSAVSAAFAVQNANAVNLLAAYTGSNLVKIGLGTPTLTATGLGDLYVTGSAEFGVGLRVGNGQSGINFTVGQAPSSQNGFYVGDSRPVRTVSLVPQFNGMISSNNPKGQLSTNVDLTAGAFRNYYNWTTTDADAQTDTLYVQIPVPRDFSALTNSDKLCFNVYSDDTNASAINTTFYDSTTAAQPSFVATPTQANAWQQQCTTNIGGTITVDGNSYVTVMINLTAAPGKNVRIGAISFDYLGAF